MKAVLWFSTNHALPLDKFVFLPSVLLIPDICITDLEYVNPVVEEFASILGHGLGSSSLVVIILLCVFQLVL